MGWNVDDDVAVYDCVFSTQRETNLIKSLVNDAAGIARSPNFWMPAVRLHIG